MNAAIPFPRALTALAVGIGASVLSAQAIAQPANSNRPAVLGGDGRFVFGQINEYNADQYMLDTHTGRLWRLVDTADGAASVLEAVPYVLPDGRTQATPPDAETLRAATQAMRPDPPSAAEEEP